MRRKASSRVMLREASRSRRTSSGASTIQTSEAMAFAHRIIEEFRHGLRQVRIDNAFKAFARLFVLENDTGEELPVHAAFYKAFHSESFREFATEGHIVRIEFVDGDIGIEHAEPARHEHFAQERFPGADATCNADLLHAMHYRKINSCRAK